MSIAGFSYRPDKIKKKSIPGRRDTGELGVFEAARYFSSCKEKTGCDPANFPEKAIREGRINTDMSTRSSLPSQSNRMEKQVKEKYKQPSSPSGRFVSFLNSLFHQTILRKKKSKSLNMKNEEEQSPGEGRRRSSSISHFRSLSAARSKPHANSGFRTPPPYTQTPAKSNKEKGSFSDHKQFVSLALFKYNDGQAKSTAPRNDKFKFMTNGVSDRHENLGNGFSEKDGTWIDRLPSEEEDFSKFSEGGDSDSSSDLFELQNYDLGLPVYETTSVGSLKRESPFTNGRI